VDFIAADLDALRAVPSNAALLGAVECRDRPGGPDLIPWKVGGFNISTHPDLVLWTAKLAGKVDERYGDGWLVFPAFLPDVPRPDHVATVSRWLEAARSA
jgi:hypothetical protein